MFRAKRDKWTCVNIWELTDQELKELLSHFDHDALVRMISLLNGNIRELLDAVEEHGRASGD